jgi:hypothetical protein
MAGVMFNYEYKAKYSKIVSYIDQQIEYYVGNGELFGFNQEELAVKILYEARSKCEGID